MKYKLGYQKFKPNDVKYWDSLKVVNHHWIIVGGSGMGKTYNIRNILRELSKQNRNSSLI